MPEKNQKQIHKKAARGHTNYKALDGNMRTFTYIDYSNVGKTVHFKGNNSLDYSKSWLKDYDQYRKESVLKHPAIYAITDDYCYDKFIDRSTPEKGILWNKEAVMNETNETLLYNLYTTLWKTADSKNEDYEPRSFEEAYPQYKKE